MSADRFVRVFEPIDATQIALVHALLDDTDFRFYIENENVFHTGGFYSHGNTSVYVMAHTEDAAAIREVLENQIG